MRVLVTGSSGRVGRAIFIRLSATHDVVGLDRSPSSTATHVGDLGDPALLRRALAGVDAIVHVAALHAPHVPHLPESEFRRVNVDATRRLLDVAPASVRRIVFTSTTALYGQAATPTGRAGWVDEALAPEPVTIYHHTKLEAEALLREAARRGGPTLRILRMSRCFPEAANVMAAFRLHRGVDARDVSQAHELALTHAGAVDDLFVISGPTPFLPEDVADLVEDAAKVLHRRSPALVSAFAARGWALPRAIDRVYVAKRAGEMLGWRPRFGFDEVLRQYDAESGEVLRPESGTRPAVD